LADCDVIERPTVFSIRYEPNISVRVMYSFWSMAVCAMVQAVPRWSLAPEARVRCQVSPSVRFTLDTVALGQVQHFSPQTHISPYTIHTNALSLGTFKTSNAVSYRERWTEKCFNGNVTKAELVIIKNKIGNK
jgi:hypothetical protein